MNKAIIFSMNKAIIFFSCLHLVTFALNQCDPKQDCSIGLVGDLVPDPYDCENYYVCMNSSSGTVPSQSPIPCPVGQYFDASVLPSRCVQETVTGICDDNYCAHYEADRCPSACPYKNYAFVVYPGDCSRYYRCTPVDITTSSCTAPTPYFNGITCVSDIGECCNRCVPYCAAFGTEIPDPTDNTKYYVCTAVGPANPLFLSSCPPGECFDSALSTCITGNTCPTFC